MPQPRIELDGTARLRRQINQLDDAMAETVNSELAEVLREAAEPVYRRALQLVPVATGATRESLRQGGGKASASVRVGRKSVLQAIFLHVGTVHMEPQPFLWRALDEREEEAARIASKGIDGIVEKVMAR